MLCFAAARARYGAGFMAEQRVKRLRDLVDRLERLPPSPDRDRVLSEVRSRAVDVDTGITPRAMLPAPDPAPPAPLPRQPRREKPRSAPTPAPMPAQTYRPAVVPLPSNELDSIIFGEDRLSLDDEDPALPPWRFGLRG